MRQYYDQKNSFVLNAYKYNPTNPDEALKAMIT